MAGQSFMRVDDVAKELGVSKSYAYKIVQKLNTELRSMGYLTISGRVDRKYFCEKLFYNGKQKNRKVESDDHHKHFVLIPKKSAVA